MSRRETERQEYFETGVLVDASGIDHVVDYMVYESQDVLVDDEGRQPVGRLEVFFDLRAWPTGVGSERLMVRRPGGAEIKVARTTGNRIEAIDW